VFDFSPIKILLIVVVTAVLLGPDKIPDVARSVGKAWRTVKTWQKRVESEVRDIVPDLPDSANLARMARNPLSLLNDLADRSEPAEPLPNQTAGESEVSSDLPIGMQLRKPLVNPAPVWQSPDGPFDPSMN